MNNEGNRKCGLCGSTEPPLTQTPCCGNWICDDTQEYELFSYDRNSCSRNHRRYTICGKHHTNQHDGDWKECDACREDVIKLELYVYYATNEYNFEVLEDPPDYDPTHCHECGDVINLGEDGFTIAFDEEEEARNYICNECHEPPV